MADPRQTIDRDMHTDLDIADVSRLENFEELLDVR